MTPEIITSRANPRVTAAAALKEHKERARTGLFLLEGARLCADAAANGVEILQAFVTAQAKQTYAKYYGVVAAKAQTVFEISGPLAQKLSDTANTQSVFCVCRKPQTAFAPAKDGFYVLTDRIQDPENLGALSRSAEAFGASGLIVCGGCDVFAPKALRASMGALLRFPVVRAEDAVTEIQKCTSLGMPALAAVLDEGAADVRTVSLSGGALLVLGNEGSGVSPQAAKACTQHIIIPMAGRAESLNAAAAGAVLLWELLGRRK